MKMLIWRTILGSWIWIWAHRFFLLQAQVACGLFLLSFAPANTMHNCAYPAEIFSKIPTYPWLHWIPEAAWMYHHLLLRLPVKTKQNFPIKYALYWTRSAQCINVSRHGCELNLTFVTTVTLKIMVTTPKIGFLRGLWESYTKYQYDSCKTCWVIA